MAIGERIKFFRTRAGMTMNYFGQKLGFPARGADVRIAQYENDSRKPKEELMKSMARVLGVRPEALNVPDIDTEFGLIHTLFAIEDIYGLTIDMMDNILCLHKDANAPEASFDIEGDMYNWYIMRDKLAHGRITKEQYDEWRYNYPASDYLTNYSGITTHERKPHPYTPREKDD